MKKHYILILVVVAVTVLGGALYTKTPHTTPAALVPPTPDTTAATTSPTTTPEASSIQTIGTSVEGRTIEAYRFGTGSTTILLVGGIHGGYEWNSVLLAHTAIKHFSKNPDSIPATVAIHIIPVLNPDGLASVVGTSSIFTTADVPKNISTQSGQGRFNARKVDLNRNFDCKWQETSSWRGAPVSAGTAPFSEPEAATLRDYVAQIQPSAVVFWHSQANTVYASECEDGVLPDTLILMNTYATAAGYLTQATFDAYPITGDAEGWLASIGIPAITVELKTRTDIEWEQNKQGLEAILNLY